MTDGVAGSGTILEGDCRTLMGRMDPGTMALSVFSPPYHVGKSYEDGQGMDEWRGLLDDTVAGVSRLLKPGGFMCVVINDILAFPDPTLPRIMGEVASARRSPVTAEDVEKAMSSHPRATRREIARMLSCSEQTVQRRLEGNDARGGKREPQTRILPVTGMVTDIAAAHGLTLYDRRIWAKDPAWANCRWTSTTYRAVDDFEHILIYWKPGRTIIDRSRLLPGEWAEWGSRGVWDIRSVRRNDDHPAKFPERIPSRLIRMLSAPGDTILDPFVGSGTTVVAAIHEGRTGVGMELDHRYASLASRNVAGAMTDGMRTGDGA